MKYKITEIVDGQYSVELNLKGVLSPNQLISLKNRLFEITKVDAFFESIVNGIDNITDTGILKYKSETLLPRVYPSVAKVL